MAGFVDRNQTKPFRLNNDFRFQAQQKCTTLGLKTRIFFWEILGGKSGWKKNDLRIAWNEFNEYSFVNRLRFRATLESNTFERQTRFVWPNFSNLHTYKDILVTFNKCLLIILLCIYRTSNM